MTGIYKKLAEHLDNLPAGYPATDTGVELRILKHLFTPEEAEAAMRLSLFPEPAGAIAQKIGKDEADTETLLYSMSKKGLISRTGREKNLYMAANFIIGMWEYHVNDLHEMLIHDVNEYLPQIWEKTWSKQKTQQHRVIPVSQSVPAELNIMPYEQAESIIKKQSKILVAPCICRKEHNMVGDGCDKPVETCMILGSGAHFYEQNGVGRTISQEEALEILNKGIEAGLVLQPSNSQKPSVICMCCGCCCMFLKYLNQMEAPARVAYTNYYATVNEDTCAACGNCEDICQMNAVKVEDESAVVNLKRCIGCGLCVSRCEFDAISLMAKEGSEQMPIPADTIEEYMTMARERGLM